MKFAVFPFLFFVCRRKSVWENFTILINFCFFLREDLKLDYVKDRSAVLMLDNY